MEAGAWVSALSQFLISVSGVAMGIGQLVKIEHTQEPRGKRTVGERPGGQTDGHRTYPALYPSCLSWSFQLDRTFASQDKGGEAGASVGPGQPDPAWSGSLHFESWLPPFEELILVQEPEERARGSLGEKTRSGLGAGKDGAKERQVPRSTQPKTFSAGPALSEVWVDRGARGELLPVSPSSTGHLYLFSQALGLPS